MKRTTALSLVLVAAALGGCGPNSKTVDASAKGGDGAILDGASDSTVPDGGDAGSLPIDSGVADEAANGTAGVDGSGTKADDGSIADGSIADGGDGGAAVNADGGDAARRTLAGLRILTIGNGMTPNFNDTKFVALLTSTTGIAPKQIHVVAPAPTLTAGDLENQDVVIVQGLTRTYSPTEAELLAGWVAAGHGLVLLSGFVVNPALTMSLASSYAVSSETTLLAPSVPAYVSDLAFPAITNGVSSLLVYGAYGFTTTDASASVFARLSTHNLGLALAHGSGRVVVWGDDWAVSDQEIDRLDSDGKAPTVTFWKNALTWVAHVVP